MEIRINGESRHFDGPLTAAQLIARLGLENERLALEINREIVPRSTFADHGISTGDHIEIVRAIGGG